MNTDKVHYNGLGLALARFTKPSRAKQKSLPLNEEVGLICYGVTSCYPLKKSAVKLEQ